MSLTEMLQITAWLTGIFIYWWALVIALVLSITHYLGERILAKIRM